MKEKCEKISNIEVVEEIICLGVIVRVKTNVFEGQNNEMMKKIKRVSVMTNSVIEKCCHRVMMGKTYWKGVVSPSALYGAEVIDTKGKEIDKLQIAENTAMRIILKNTKGGRTGSNKRRDRNKQHEVEHSKEQASLPKKDRSWK